jgi:fructose-bisphosphate aldolase, class II
MPLVTLKEVLADADRNHYGIPCMLGGNLEMLLGYVKAAEEIHSPLIMCFNQGVTPTVPMEQGMPLVVRMAQQAKVPVATILDHGSSLEAAVRAIHLGSSSVMFDGSNLPYEENVQQTKAIVEIAHAVGVSVEAELGHVGGSSVELGMDYSPSAENTMTDPKLAVEFVERTGVDALAIAFGNIHGIYRGEPNLDLPRVRKIREMVDIPLVMHGASGLTDDDYANIMDCGISKINYYTAMARRVSNKIKTSMEEADSETITYHELIADTIELFYEDTKQLLTMLRCAGRVTPI